MKIQAEVLEVLEECTVCESNTARILEQLDPPQYRQVDKVLQALGGKWNRARKAHVFPEGVSARERIEQVCVLGEVTTHQELGFFPTPERLANQLVDMAEVSPGHVCLEPEAGEGAIVAALLARRTWVHAIEIDQGRFDGMVRRWGAQPLDPEDDLEGYGQNFQIVRRADTMLRIQCADFLNVPMGFATSYNRVVMNPAFCRVGRGDHLDHVQWAWSALRTGGVLVSVLPVSVKWRKDRRHTDFRFWAMEQDAYEEPQFIDLPEDAFKASGTKVRTCVLKMRKAL